MLGDSPPSKSRRFLQAFYHFAFGAVVAILPALLVFTLVSGNPEKDVIKVFLTIYGIFSCLIGSILALLSLMGKTNITHSILKVLNMKDYL